ncbi:uncharacterized protein BKA55DRAFT_581030 [Fusarium redolens]|uniref:Acetylesterase n=1 Tax=Fusarium redolens TaxID=48865 RepID=A0A9P9G5G9_FUSRE|nr:uncharacterized protein BKA55DRAFT_581030 [Fusarium redolens]KAH7232367.1 hypothetical protein BKA55DRAFT_581030 [Fusarium redolens]
MSEEKMSLRPLTTAAFIVVTFIILALPFIPGMPSLPTIIPMITPHHFQEPSERFIIAFGDSYSRSGFRMNYTYTRTGPQMDDMERTDRPNDKLLDCPRAENPIGNPQWPGKTSSGGQNWAMYMATEFNTTLTLAYIFARSGSVVDAEIIPPRRKSTFTFAHQIIHFKDSIGHRPHYAAWTAKNIVATIWFGLNDLSIAFNKKGRDDLLEAANQRMFELSEILYDTGIRSFIFIEIPPMELFPSHQAKKLHDNNYKHEKVSYAINLWNSLLRQNTALFRQAHPDAKVTYVEIWDLFYQAFLHPESLGARNSTCVDPNGKDCLWANPGHPGEKIHQLIGARIAEKAWGSAVI